MAEGGYNDERYEDKGDHLVVKDIGDAQNDKRKRHNLNNRHGINNNNQYGVYQFCDFLVVTCRLDW